MADSESDSDYDPEHDANNPDIYMYEWGWNMRSEYQAQVPEHMDTDDDDDDDEELPTASSSQRSSGTTPPAAASTSAGVTTRMDASVPPATGTTIRVVVDNPVTTEGVPGVPPPFVTDTTRRVTIVTSPVATSSQAQRLAPGPGPQLQPQSSSDLSSKPPPSMNLPNFRITVANAPAAVPKATSLPQTASVQKFDLLNPFPLKPSKVLPKSLEKTRAPPPIGFASTAKKNYGRIVIAIDTSQSAAVTPPKQNRIPNIKQTAPAPSSSSNLSVVSAPAVGNRELVAGFSGAVTTSSNSSQKSQAADENMMEVDDQPMSVDEGPEPEAVDSHPSPGSSLRPSPVPVPAINDASSLTYENFQEICKTVPYLEIPCHFGFKRITRFGPMEKNSANAWILHSKVIYENTKDHVPLTSMEEVHAYLQENQIVIPVSCFTFETEIQPGEKYFRDYWQDEGMILNEDLSNGLENWPIPVICQKSASEASKTLATYVTTSIIGEKAGLRMEHDEKKMICCDCPDDCKDKLNCPCFQKTLDNCSQETIDAEGDANIGYEFQRLSNPVPSGIFECNRNCKCREKTCFNRVVQLGLLWQLQLFMTRLKGFGVRTLEDIPKGSFICTYRGEIISGELADEISKNFKEMKWKYLMKIGVEEVGREGYEAEVVTPEEEPKPKKRAPAVDSAPDPDSEVKVNPPLKMALQIDGMQYGNIGRYMNHSCDPNVFAQHVFVESHDLRLPEVGIFALRNIRAGEELCWDYNYEVEGEDKKEDDNQMGSDQVGGTGDDKNKHGENDIEGTSATPTGSTSAAQPGTGQGIKRKREDEKVELPCYCASDNCKKIFCTSW